jgi:hypothetical protein
VGHVWRWVGWQLVYNGAEGALTEKPLLVDLVRVFRLVKQSSCQRLDINPCQKLFNCTP